jgi:hypothetical protein
MKQKKWTLIIACLYLGKDYAKGLNVGETCETCMNVCISGNRGKSYDYFFLQYDHSKKVVTSISLLS